MSQYFVLEPEVAGGLGPNAILDTSVHPPVVSRLHYLFEGWLGDAIVESFPCFLVLESLAEQLTNAAVTGFEIADAEIETSEQFREHHPDVELPTFVWMKPVGVAGVDDVGLGPDHRVVVSEKVLRLIEATHPRQLDIEPFRGSR